MIKNESTIDRVAIDALHKEVIARFKQLEVQQTEPLNAKTALSIAAESCRDILATRWAATQKSDAKRSNDSDCRRVHYLSMEFLMGRALGNALAALGLESVLRNLLSERDIDLADALDAEPDAALGNGGLGRLAACFLDSFAELGLPAFGYGLRYRYGMFAQTTPDGRQVEAPDDWLHDKALWDIERPEIEYFVGFGGRVEANRAGGRTWLPSERIRARAFDFVVPSHNSARVATLRQWQALAEHNVDFAAIVSGNYAGAAKSQWTAESLNWVLYPDDSHAAGRELRLRQEALLVSASLQDLLQRHLKEFGTLENLGQHNAIHLNDTHPALAPVELMRLLLDVQGMDWDSAWQITTQAVSYTNHTLMPEALETWPVQLMEYLLPRHLELIYSINHHFLTTVRAQFPNDESLAQRVSIIDETAGRRVRMAALAVVSSHRVNGVAALHSKLMVETIFSDFAKIFPVRFHNVTNGITPRRWLQQANPSLSLLIDNRIGKAWRQNLNELKKLSAFAEDTDFSKALSVIKNANKSRLAERILKDTGVTVDTSSLFDVQIKRIHEYKRQLLNLLHAIARYQAMLSNPQGPDGKGWQSRTIILAGKAASAYHTAKLIIQLAHDIARVVNNDTRLNGKLKLAFLPNYGVSLAETIIPAADLSEQISTAGTEASGTGNMKFALNGALTIGTWDGATIEMAEAIGPEHVFVFGHRSEAIAEMRELGYSPRLIANENASLQSVLNAISSGMFSPSQPQRYKQLIDDLLNVDRYFLLADFADYCATQERVDALFAQPKHWNNAVTHNIAGMGMFSTDRTIQEYVERVWSTRSQLTNTGSIF
ncbi:MAG TPA: glycogen/starch/alpha-glucan phosphorylase [Arenimonas sp.]|nr:glycogen/starch/alpha-glucan phosphorylase [Arenimonas sp.]